VKGPVPRQVVLVGMMGSGKTSVGRLLAERTGWPYLDNDAMLQASSGHTAREVAARGEDELRRAEMQSLARAMESAAPVIIGAAAGVVLDPGIGELLHGAFVVWLRASPSVLAERATGGEHRPWLGSDPAAWLAQADAARAPAYRAVATMEVETDRLSPSEAAQAIYDRLAAGGQSGTIGS
jgi:shikimate kinase